MGAWYHLGCSPNLGQEQEIPLVSVRYPVVSEVGSSSQQLPCYWAYAYSQEHRQLTWNLSGDCHQALQATCACVLSHFGLLHTPCLPCACLSLFCLSWWRGIHFNYEDLCYVFCLITSSSLHNQEGGLGPFPFNWSRLASVCWAQNPVTSVVHRSTCTSARPWATGVLSNGNSIV